MRIHELAKKYNVASEDLIDLLAKHGHKVPSANSTVEADMLTVLDKHLKTWSNTPTKKTTRKTSAATKAAKAVAAAEPVRAKVKLRKAKPAAPEPAPEPAPEKPKVKLAKAPKAPAPEPPKVETAAEAAPAKAAKKTEKKSEAKVEAKASKKTESRKETSKAEAEAPHKGEEKPRAPKPPRVRTPNPLDELSQGPMEPLIAVEPDTGDEPEEWTAADEARRHAALHPRTSDAEQVRESVRRTLAKLETTRKTKRRKPRLEEPKELPPVRVQEGATPDTLAGALGVSLDELLSRLSALDIKAESNAPLEKDAIELVAEDFGRKVDVEASYGETQLKIDAQIDVTRLVTRAPVVTIMGHVDHGKTSILDYIRKANVAAGEAGGITQHIGAYEATLPNGKITFIDTPGHEAFTAMRSRGARITDIVVIVVAADDGVMPQTVEAINHTRAAGVPMIVAINKSDLPGANPMAVKQQLMAQNVLVEEFGGEVVCVEVSAKTGKGIDKLLEMILLQAELAELKADPTAPAQGVVVETKKEEGRGILVTVLVQQGTLHIGDVFVVGNEYGKVRSLFDYNGKAVRLAGPSTPVVVLGLDGLPEPGDTLIAVKNEREAREIAIKRQEVTRSRDLQPIKALTLEQLYEQIQGGEVKELNIVLKCDTNGSMEALRDSLSPMVVENVKVNVMHAAVGNVSESDALLALNTGAVIIAFNTKVTPKAKDIIKLKGVDVRSYKIIYEVIEDIDKAMKGMLKPVFVERVLGRAEVRKLFHVGRLGTIAGSMVTDGQIVRSANVRVLRNEEVIFNGKIASLKRFQDDVREVNTNFECGIGLQGFDNLVEHDIIEAYVVEEKARVF
ncbi:MAG TPA: translation initiation factor IF-2 [Candidatus Krumholzibacteria bacterium]|nr:translation initiation factor IF-2 [Candidatus Krumholzibacteria bacterium]